MLVLTMRKKKYSVTLTESERDELKQLVAAGTASARKLTHARVLLKADQPLVCMDEVSKQLLRDTREPLPAKPGSPKRVDYEYERGGVANLFLFCEPLVGRRWVDVTEHRTKVDWAHQIKQMVDVRYPEAERIVLVMDNLNTHSPASLYETFEPAEAKRLSDKLQIHYTPKHGSWLNIAEIELSVLSRQCLDQTSPYDPPHIRAATVATKTGTCSAIPHDLTRIG